MPYAPGIQYDASPLGRGIAQAGANLRGWLSDTIDRSRKSKALDPVLLEYAGPEGSEQRKTLKQALGGMSVDEKEGLLQAGALKMTFDKLRQEQQFKREEGLRSDRAIRVQEGQLSMSQEKQAAGQRFTRSLADLGAQPMSLGEAFASTSAGMNQPRTLGLADVAQAAAGAGLAMDPEQVGTLAVNEQRQRTLAERDDKPDKRLTRVTLGGVDYVMSPDTGAFQQQPSMELSPADKQRYIASLRQQRRQLIQSRANALDQGTVPLIDQELAVLDEELAGLGAKVGSDAAPKGAGGGLSFDDFKAGSWRKAK
jgi:hypothetical protein